MTVTHDPAPNGGSSANTSSVAAWPEYMIDALQRSIHFLDFLRRRDDEKIEIISRRLGTLPLRHSASLPPEDTAEPKSKNRVIGSVTSTLPSSNTGKNNADTMKEAEK